MLRYAEVSSDGNVLPTGLAAHGQNARSAQETEYVKAIDRAPIIESLTREYVVKRKAKTCVEGAGMPGEVERTFPTTGEIHGIIILAEFTDKKFSRDDISDIYNDMANEENYSGEYSSGSIRDYFVAQSGGKFVPSFDIVGPVELPHETSYYARDEVAIDLMIDACKAADANAGTDFSKYDYNEDGMVDFVFVIYAGYGQAQGGGGDTVWPQSVDLTYYSWDTYDGLYLSQSACSSELRGSTGEMIDGIGTFCHEFSHILGLPDIYDPVYSGMQGMLTWDVMDVGLYNDDSRTPAGYTAMDKYTVGWLEPVVLDKPATGLTLNPLSETNEAYFIVCGTDRNEYYTLENRQQTGWDKGLGGHGLIVSHIHYDKSIWASNHVNTTSSGYEHVALVPADNIASQGTEDGDPFPGVSGNTQFTDTSLPAAFWHTTAAAVDCPITNIREENGVITFDFKAESTGIGAVEGGVKPCVSVAGGLVSVENPEGLDVCISSADGRIVARSKFKTVECRPGSGVYIVSCGGIVQKIVVK